MKKALSILFVFCMTLFIGTSVFAEEQSVLNADIFGYAGYEAFQDLPDFSGKLWCLSPEKEYDPNAFYIDDDWFETDVHLYKYKPEIRDKYLEQFGNTAKSSPIVLVVDARTDQQIQFLKTGGDTGFTVSCAAVKAVLRNECAAELTAGGDVWLRENYWIAGQYVTLDEYVEKYLQLYDDIARHSDPPLTIDEYRQNVIDSWPEGADKLFSGTFYSRYDNYVSPLCGGDVLVFASIDEEAKNTQVLKINDLYKFSLNDPDKYPTNQHYRFQRFIQEVIGREVLTYFGFEGNPNYSFSPDYPVPAFDPLAYDWTFVAEAPTTEPTTEPTPDPTTEPTPDSTTKPTDEPPTGTLNEPEPVPEPETSSLFLPVAIGFGAGVLICLVPTVIVLTVRRRKSCASVGGSTDNGNG